MNARRSHTLPAAPASVEDHRGQPRFGTYAGSLREVNLARLQGAYRLPAPIRFAKHKRWHYVMLATRDVLAVLSVADLGYAANAFACAVDLRTHQVLFDGGYMGLPRPFTAVSNYPAAGALARFRAPGAAFCFSGEGDSYRIDAQARGRRGPGFSCRAQVAAGLAPPLTMIAPVPADGVVNVTQKSAALTLTGLIEAGGQTYALEGGTAGLDYTNGYLARKTSWRWAFASGRLAQGVPFGLNIVQGFNEASDEANENALWLADQLIPLGRGRFEYDPADVLQPWRVTTAEGAVDLIFRPTYAHREERDYKIVRSHFVQPLGLFEGKVKVGRNTLSIEKLPGVVEDQEVLW